jgi:hypothetical protein
MKDDEEKKRQARISVEEESDHKFLRAARVKEIGWKMELLFSGARAARYSRASEIQKVERDDRW